MIYTAYKKQLQVFVHPYSCLYVFFYPAERDIIR